MKKKFLVIIILLILAVVGFLFYKHKSNVNDNEKVETVEKQKPQTYEIDGILTEGTMNSITIKTSEGIIYSFSTEEVDMSKVSGLIIGVKLHIKYYGILDKNKDFQNGQIKEISSVEDEDTYPIAWNDDGIFSAYYKKAYEKLKTMSKEEKAGQLLLARVPEINQVEDIKTYHLGGYILFGRDTKNKTK